MSEGAVVIDARIEALDVSLFDAISTQSYVGDHLAWLAVQRASRGAGGYNYLEIGSHLGGSIQQHIVDPRCHAIISIDKRPPSQPDDRGEVFVYQGNSTARMLDNLRRLAPDRVDQIACFDADAGDIDPAALPAAPDFCFIDGEHTHAAVLSDFAFCLKVCAPNAAICFHDDAVVYPALAEIVADLKGKGIPFVARKLTGLTFGIFLRDCPAAGDPYIAAHSRDAERWFRLCRIRSLLPAPLLSLARGAAGMVRR